MCTHSVFECCVLCSRMLLLKEPVNRIGMGDRRQAKEGKKRNLEKWHKGAWCWNAFLKDYYNVSFNALTMNLCTQYTHFLRAFEFTLNLNDTIHPVAHCSTNSEKGTETETEKPRARNKRRNTHNFYAAKWNAKKKKKQKRESTDLYLNQTFIRPPQ